MNRKLTNDDIQKAVKVFKYSAHVNDDKDVLKLIKSSWDFQSLMVASVLEVAEDVSDEIMRPVQLKSTSACHPITDSTLCHPSFHFSVDYSSSNNRKRPTALS